MQDESTPSPQHDTDPDRGGPHDRLTDALARAVREAVAVSHDGRVPTPALRTAVAEASAAARDAQLPVDRLFVALDDAVRHAGSDPEAGSLLAQLLLQAHLGEPRG